MRRLAILVTLAVAASACAARRPIVIVTPTLPPSTVAPTSIAVSTPSPLPEASRPTLPPLAEAVPADPRPTVPPTDIADLPGNLATGEAAPEFTARLLGGGTFRLLDQRGSYVLLLPTIIGCGECLFSLSEISTAFPDYRRQGVKVVILNLYTDDAPESWQEYADYFAEPEFVWGVVDSPEFLENYNIRTLGTKVLIDPDGDMVYWNEYPLVADGFRQLFDLATR